jgi:Ran GTPase-activating protein (RanGAP) involved in mRNA processing and transport
MLKSESKVKSPILEDSIQPLLDGTTPSIFSLCSKGIDSYHLHFIGVDIALNGGITSLDLSDNPLGDEGSTLLAAILISQRAIQSIYLRSINVSDPGLEAISNSLLFNTVLTSLDLSSNRLVGTHGMEMLAKAMDSNFSICRVCLGDTYTDGVYSFPTSSWTEKYTQEDEVRNASRNSSSAACRRRS